MPVHISQADLKTNVWILIEFAKTRTGPLAAAASGLASLWMTQLTETSKRDLSLAGLDLEGFGG